MIFEGYQTEDPLGGKLFFWEKRQGKMSQARSSSSGVDFQEDSIQTACVQSSLKLDANK